MDRFKFRAWHNESKGYYYFDLYDLNKHSLDDYEEEDIEQSTGLKDKNGKLIYEGDVLKSKYSDVMRYEVVYKNAGLCLRVYSIDNIETMDYLHIGEAVESIGLYEIIGNIHENPELLEE